MSTSESARGFTLIELLVVTAIMVVVSTIIFADNNRFGGRVLLQNLAYDVALSVRQAQVYGISVQRFGASTFSAGYGMHFDISNPTAFVLFADALTHNGLYDCPSPGTPEGCELVQATAIASGFRIHDLCVTAPSQAEHCGVGKLDLLFERPEPDAWISSEAVSCIIDHGTCAESARISLIAPRGDIMSVAVQANGQISVQQ